MASPQNPPPAAPGSFKNRTVIVSGACGTIGRAVCTALAAASANLVAYDIHSAPLSEFVTELQTLTPTVLGVAVSPTSGKEVVAAAVEKFGTVHAIVNTALGPIPWSSFEESTDEGFQAQFTSTVLGPVGLTRAAWPYFRAQKSGRVVNFTSDAMLGMPSGITYVMTKGALFGMNKTLAMEGAADNIKVNCVSPIAFKPVVEPFIAHYDEDVKTLFRTEYSVGGNVPMILALVSEGCAVSGEVFQTAGMSVTRNVWGTVEGEKGLSTVEACLEKVDALSQRNKRKVFEPGNTDDFTRFRADWVMKKGA